MKTLLLFALAVCSSLSHAAATATYVRGCANSASSGTVTCAFGANITAGNLIVVRSKTETDTASTPTVVISTSSGVSLTWTTVYTPALVGIQATGKSFATTMAYAIVPTTGAQTVAATWTNSDGAFSDITVAEYSATSGWVSPPLDQSTSNSSGASYNVGTSCSTGTTGTLAQANELVIMTCETWGSAQTWSTGGGYTHRSASERNTDGWFDMVSSSTTGVSRTVSISSDVWLGHITTFKMLNTVMIRHRVRSD